MSKLFVSYAQHADDFIAFQLLGKPRNGVVVEVGAFDGVHLSNSYAFDQMGWKTICIEPNPDIFKYLVKQRPNATNINKAIVSDDKIDSIDFFQEKIGVLSGCNFDEEDVKERYRKRGLKYEPPITQKVAAITLSSLMRDIEIDKIDILSVDVEGFETEVLGGMDFQNIKVNLIIIEANNVNSKNELLQYFHEISNFVHVGDNGQNMFFIQKDLYSKIRVKNLDFGNYYKAEQKHPVSDSLTINSTPPKFIRSKRNFFQKFFGGL